MEKSHSIKENQIGRGKRVLHIVGPREVNYSVGNKIIMIYDESSGVLKLNQEHIPIQVRESLAEKQDDGPEDIHFGTRVSNEERHFYLKGVKKIEYLKPEEVVVKHREYYVSNRSRSDPEKILIPQNKGRKKGLLRRIFP